MWIKIIWIGYSWIESGWGGLENLVGIEEGSDFRWKARSVRV